MQYLCLAMLALVAVAAAQTRPVISNTFAAQVRIETHDHDETIFGEGGIVQDVATQRALEEFRLHREGRVLPLNVYQLQRYDLAEVFEIDSEDKNECKMRVVSGRMPEFWAWLSNATYAGQDVFHHVTVDLWRLEVGSVYLEVGVISTETDRPIFLRRGSHGHDEFIEFTNFLNETSIDQKYFDIPKECTNNSTKTHAVLLVADPPRPTIPENFEAELKLKVTEGSRTFLGEGKWANNAAIKRSVSDLYVRDERTHEQSREFTLNAYDLGIEYQISSLNHTQCERRATPKNYTGSVFEFVKYAKYDGEKQGLEFWSYTAGGFTLKVAVEAHDRSVPVGFVTETSHFFEEIEFVKFVGNHEPAASTFEVPSFCKKLQ